MVRGWKGWGLLLALALLLLLWQGGRAGVRAGLREFAVPVENGAARWRRQVWPRLKSFAEAGRLSSENRRLREESDRLRVEVVRLAAAAAECERLRGALGAPPSVREPVEACLVLSRGGSAGWWRQLRIGKGTRNGVWPGCAVMSADGLVGRVVEATATTADVRLITDPNSRIACELEPPPPGIGTVRGILYGGGWGAPSAGAPEFLHLMEPLRLRYLQREVEPAPRTRIVTSGLGGDIPAGLAVGYLLSSEVDANGLYRIGEVLPAADLAALEVVFVLRKGGGP